MLTKRHHCVSVKQGWIILVVLMWATADAHGQSGGAEFPFRIQRVLAQPANLVKELDKVQQGTLIPWPVQDLDARLDRLQKMMQIRAVKPRLTLATYRAELIGSTYLQGSGQWQILHPAKDPALLPIDSLNLALGKLRWEQGTEALLAEFDTKSLSLLIPQPNSQTCFFDWSSRGVPGDDGLAFSLEVPPCPITILDIKLPAEHWLASPKNAVLIHGPLDSGSAAQRLWKVHAAGLSRIDLLVRNITELKGPGPTLFARVQNVQAIERDRIVLTHDFHVDILHGSVGELHLESDHAIQPIEVSIKTGEVKRWQWVEGSRLKDAKGKTISTPGVLKIEFHQPVQGKLQGLRVRSLSSIPVGNEWISPDLRVRGAMTRGEVLQLQLHPDLAIGKWDAGTFLILQSTTDPDGRQTLSVADAAANAASSRRPTIVLERGKIDVSTKEDYALHISPRGASLLADIQYTATHGSLFEFQLKLPKAFLNYHVESLELQPQDLLRGAHQQGDTLIVELKQALQASAKVRLKLRLRNAIASQSSTARTLVFPEVEPTDATHRSGTVAIYVDPTLTAQLLASSLPRGGIADTSIQSHAIPAFQFAFRDQRFNASVRVTPLPIRLQQRAKHLVRLIDSGATVTSRWEIEPIAGEPEYLDFRFAPGFPPTWRLLAEDGSIKVHHWERLHAHEAVAPLLNFGVSSAMHAAMVQALSPAGPCWRFHLAEPLRKKGSITIEATLPAGMSEEQWRKMALHMPQQQPWEQLGNAMAAESLPKSAASKYWRVPMMMPLKGAMTEQEIVLESKHEPIEKYAIQNVAMIAPETRQGAPALRSTLSLHGLSGFSFLPPDLTMITRPEMREASLLEFCDDAGVTTFVHSEGRIEHRIRFRLWHWRDRTCVIGLPAGYQLASAKLQDHWLDRADIVADSNGVRVGLPFDRNVESVCYEIFVRGPANEPIVPGMFNVRVPKVDWPVAPLQVKTHVCLAKNLVPVHHETLASIGTPERFAGASPTQQWLRSLWTVGQAWWPRSELSLERSKLDQQRQTVLLAAAKFRSSSSRAIKLGDALEIFAVQHLKDECPLVLDQTALRSLGLSAETLLTDSGQGGRPFWESLGLLYVPAPYGALLTAPRRIEQFGIDHPADVHVLSGAMREAILHGQDASASFATALFWTKNAPNTGGSTAAANGFSVAEDLGEFREMSEWRIVADNVGTLEMIAVDRWTARLLGWLIAAISGALLLLLRRKMSVLSCTRVDVLLLTFALILSTWSPANIREYFILPSVGVEFALLVWGVIRLLNSREEIAARSATTLAKQTGAGVAVGLLILSLGVGISAQPIAPRVYSVLIVDGAKPTALLTPDLIAKLDELEAASNAAEHGPVLVSAKYDGTIRDQNARFDAVFELHSAKDQDTLLLPLVGVQLLDQTYLDGIMVYPTVNKNSFAIPIRGKGPHQLRLAFNARVTANNDHVDLRFSIPKLAQNRLALHWVKPVQAVHCLYCLGEEHRTVVANSAISKWDGQLGYENIVHVRWTGAPVNPGVNSIGVKEAHYWDLRPDSVSLVSSFQYAIGKNSLGQLNIALAEGLFVRAVEVHSSITPAAVSTAVPVKNWHVAGKGAQRRLIVELVQPISGNITLQLDVVPQTISLQRQVTLPLPAPMQGKSTSGLLGYRLDANEVRSAVQNLSVQGINVAEFDLAWKKHCPRALVPPPSRAYNFQRKSQQAGLELIIQTALRHAEFDLEWNADLLYADLRGRFTITSPLEDLSMIELFVDPAVTVADVVGADVRRWTLTKSTLQIWLRATSKRAAFELIGWHAAASKVLPNKQTFPLPRIYPMNMQTIAGSLALKPAPGTEIDVGQLHHLRPHVNQSLHFHIDDTDYDASVVLRVSDKVRQARSVTKISKAESGIEFTQRIHISGERSGPSSVTLHARNWSGETLTIDAPGATIQPLKTKTNSLAWALKYPSGSPSNLEISISGRHSGEKNASILPIVDLDVIAILSSHLIWKDVECVQVETGRKIVHQPASKDEVGQFLRTAGMQPLTGWNVAPAPTSVKVTSAKSPPRANVHVLSMNQWIQQDDRRHWIYSLDCWIHAAEPASLRLQFPGKIDQLGVWIDHRLAPLRTSEVQTFTLPLEASRGPHHVRMRWKFFGPMSSPVRFAALPIDLQSAEVATEVLWIPPGLVAEEEQKSPYSALLDRLLKEAETHSQISAALAADLTKMEEVPTKMIQARQQQFQACIRQAEYTVKIVAGQLNDFDAVGWQNRIDAVKRKNGEYAKERRFERQRESAENAKPSPWKLAPFTGPADLGTPWVIQPAGAAPNLVSAQNVTLDDARTRSEWLLLAAIFLLVFSYFRHGISLLCKLAPEAALAATLFAMWFVGFSLVGLLIIVAMVAVQCWRLRKAWLSRSTTRDSAPQGASTVQPNPPFVTPS